MCTCHAHGVGPMTSPRTAILCDVRVFGPACRSVNTLDLTLTGSSNGANVHTYLHSARETPRVRECGLLLFARGFVRRSTFRESSGTARACETVESESRAGATARARAEPQRGAARAAAEGADPCLVPTSQTACSRLATPLHMPRPTPRPLYSHCVRASAGTSAALLDWMRGLQRFRSSFPTCSHGDVRAQRPETARPKRRASACGSRRLSLCILRRR